MKIITKLGSFMATLAIMAVTLNVNATCTHHLYQETVPDSAKKLNKIQ